MNNMSNWIDHTTLISGSTLVWYFDEDEIKVKII